jgi:hypothetical protein
VRVDPRCAPAGTGAAEGGDSGQLCGELTTRTFELRAGASTLTLNLRAGEAAGGGGVRVAVLGKGKGSHAGSHALAGFDAADSLPLLEDAHAAPVRWRGGAQLAQLAGQRVRLRFQLCGGAVLFAWTLRAPNATGPA